MDFSDVIVGVSTCVLVALGFVLALDWWMKRSRRRTVLAQALRDMHLTAANAWERGNESGVQA